jgi:hypothetical protein
MLRLPTRRILGLVLAFAYLATPAGVQAARVCPHHDAAAPADAEAAAHAHHADAEASDPEPAGTCNCLGACTISYQPALTHAATTLVVPVHMARYMQVHTDTSAPRDARIPHLLPFAHAPPQSSIHS